MKLLDFIKELENKSDGERLSIILNFLENNKCEYEIERFRYFDEESSNIILEIGRGEKEILLVNNYDSFPNSPGANDNASGVAVSLDIYKKLVEYKKKGLLNWKVKVIFFGKNQPSKAFPQGRIGSRVYIKEHKKELDNIIAVLNPYLSGAGDSIFFWPVLRENKGSEVLEIIKKVLDKLKINYDTAGNLISLYPDYESFREAGVKNSFCFMSINENEKSNVKLYASYPSIEILARNFLGKIFKAFQVSQPELFLRYHTSEDKSYYLDESTLKMMSNALFNIIVNLDRKFAKGLERF